MKNDRQKALSLPEKVGEAQFTCVQAESQPRQAWVAEQQDFWQEAEQSKLRQEVCSADLDQSREGQGPSAAEAGLADLLPISI